MSDRICSIDDCSRPHKGRGLCDMHLRRERRWGDPLVRRGFVSDMDRFLAKVDKNGAVPAHRPDLGPCWLWTASLGSGGYGQFYDGTPIPKGSHRWFWEQTIGAIPESLELDHLCYVRRCVNPGHLEPVTQLENIRRGDSPPARNARADVCASGHELTGDNLYLRKDRPGRRQCRECSRIAKRTSA